MKYTTIMSFITCLFLSYTRIAQSVPVLQSNCDQFNVTLNSHININLNGIYNATKLNASMLYLQSNTIQLILSYNPIKILWIKRNNETQNVSIELNTFHCMTKTDETHIPHKNALLAHNMYTLSSFNMNRMLSDLLKYIDNPTNDTNLIITCILFALILLLICVCCCCLYSQCRNNTTTRCCSCDCCCDDSAPAAAPQHRTQNMKENTSITEHIQQRKSSLNTTSNNSNSPNMSHETGKIVNINSESIEENKNDKESIIEIERKASVTSVGSVGSSLFGTQDGDDHGVTSGAVGEKEYLRQDSCNTFKSDVAIKGSMTDLHSFDDEKSIFLMETTAVAGSHASVSSLGSENSWSEAYNNVNATPGAMAEDEIISETSTFTQDTANQHTNFNFNLQKKIISRNNRNPFQARTRMTNPISEVSEVSGRPFSSKFGSKKSESRSSSHEFVEIQAIIGDVGINQHVQFMSNLPAHHQ